MRRGFAPLMDDNSPTISLLLKVGLEIPEGQSYHLDLRVYLFRHRILGKGGRCYIAFTASFSALATLKAGAFVAGISISHPIADFSLYEPHVHELQTFQLLES